MDGKQILIIEDDEVLNTLIVDHLNAMGHEAFGTHTWAESREILAAREPDLVVLDVRLPDAEGQTLISELSARQPVIVLTAYGSVRDAVHAINLNIARIRKAKPL